MTTPIKISEIIDGMDLPMEGSDVYFDKKTVKIMTISEEDIPLLKSNEPLDTIPEWQREYIKELREVMSREEDLIPLPSKIDIHEHSIMENFCLSLKDEHISSEMQHAIKGSGAFRRFKDGIHRYIIADQWYRFRDEAIYRIAIDWCKKNGIEYIDDIKTP